MNGIAA